MTRGQARRRSLFIGAAGVGAAALLPPASAVAGPTVRTVPAGRPSPVPPVIRSREALTGAPRLRSALPITQHGTTFNLAQVVRWLDAEHFAVGRWDGTMSIFDFETAPFAGPQVTDVVNTPSAQGVRMITPLPRRTLVTSNDEASLAVWVSRDAWTDVRRRATVEYPAALGAAASGAWFAEPATLVVGHDSGYLSVWSFDPASRALALVRTVDIRNPDPVNPFDSHVVYGLDRLVPAGAGACAVAGSDDGYVSIVDVPSGAIRSQTVFNPAAQRGINSVAARGDRLLVANCSVGADDDNLWYFAVNLTTGALSLLDSMNLIIDPAEVQSFNFNTIWAEYGGGPCWFAGTEEGALWMGTAGAALDLVGYQPLGDGAIGAALDYRRGPGRLAAVIHNLNQFTTGAP
ncbi:hypothetical protein WEI85_15710 [Actinomycetes bacterium KLBMP 9797]